MRNIFSSTILCLMTIAFAPGYAQSVSLQVTVDNIKEQKGTIRIGLFTNENDFLKNASHGKVVKATGKLVTVIFENLPSGEYAVSVIHDENENEILDANILGIPKEGFGFGNNTMGMFGPPSWEKTKIRLDQNGKQLIRLRYF
jgi:uncharacterized protein (DUF2141 family)